MRPLEISIFGGASGYGESIVIHYGDDNWIVVDSFLSNGLCMPLTYLKKEGVELTNVKFIIGTHWDNDHINGLQSLLKDCTNSKFVCTAAYKNEEFTTLIEMDRSNPKTVRSLNIFNEILKIVNEERGQAPIEAVENLTIDKLPAFGISLVSLSPSPKSVYETKQSLSALIKSAKFGKKISSQKPNDRSVVLLLTVGDLEILLGADLEVSSHSDKGWEAILNSKLCPARLAIFKVPHHGSKNGFYKKFWDEKLTKNTLSATTPFSMHELPTEEDLIRITSYTPGNSYLTSGKHLSKSIKFGHAVDKLLDRLGKSIYDLDNSEYGHVKFTKDTLNSESDWLVECNGSAIKL